MTTSNQILLEHQSSKENTPIGSNYTMPKCLFLLNRYFESALRTISNYQGRQPSAVRYKNWKFYYTMMGSTGLAALNPATTYHWTQVQNIKRDPFEDNVGAEQKGALAAGGALASPSTAYLYDWNLLPIGQLLWTKELMSYIDYPPLQLAASYNLEQVLDQVREMTKDHPSQ
jgi:hypothetical protein